MFKKIAGNSIVYLFSILWAAYLFLDYINYSPYLIQAWKFSEYHSLMIVLTAVTVLFTYLLSGKKKSFLYPEIKNFRGIYHYLFLLLIMLIVCVFYLNKTDIVKSAGTAAFTFLFRTIGFHLELLFILLSALCCGGYFLQLLNIKTDNISAVLISIAVGFLSITMLLFFLGIAGLLNPYTIYPLLVLLIIPYRKKILPLLNELLFRKQDGFKMHILFILAYAFLLLVMAINLIAVTRAFPIGYDGLNLYMNVSKLIAGYQGLVNGGDAYNWSIMMSLGFILYNNTVVCILLSIIPGILSVFAIYRLCKNLNISGEWSLLASVIFYSLPVTIWMSRNDEKTDLALLFFSLASLLLIQVKAEQTKPRKDEKPLATKQVFPFEYRVWALAGLLIGFSFGIKYLAMLTVFSMLVVLFYREAGRYAAIAIFFLNFALIYGLDLTRFAAFNTDLFTSRFIAPLIPAIIFLGISSYKNKNGMLQAMKKSLVFLLFTGITFLPWAIKHINENKIFSVEAMLTGKSPLPPLYMDSPYSLNREDGNKPGDGLVHQKKELNVTGVYYAGLDFSDLFGKRQENELVQNDVRAETKPEKSLVEKTEKSYTNIEKEEEIRRHLGYENGIIRFLSVPYDLAMKINVSVVASDPGILLLILFPVFALVLTFTQTGWNIIRILILVFTLVASIISVLLKNGPFDFNTASAFIHQNSFMNLNGFREIALPVYAALKVPLLNLASLLTPLYDLLTLQSLGLCFIILAFTAIPVYFMYRKSLSFWAGESKLLVLFIYCIIQYWLVLSSGILWYGIAGFSLTPVIISLVADKNPLNTDNPAFLKYYISICILIWFLLIGPIQFMPTEFRQTTEVEKVNYRKFINPHFMKYAVGEKNEKSVFSDFFNPQQKNILNALNRDKNSRILNVSTFMNYFITNNDIRVYQDNQLGIFQGIYNNAKQDKSLFAAELKKAKIKYILVSLNAGNLDITPDKSLRKKFNTMMVALVNNPEIQLLYTDRIMERPDGDMNLKHKGQRVKAKFEVLGYTIIDPGTNALFEVL